MPFQPFRYLNVAQLNQNAITESKKAQVILNSLIYHDFLKNTPSY